MGQSVENFIHVLTMAGEEENTNPKVWEAVAMADHFEKIQKLPDKIDGVPNFRRVPGYKVYCCGQPTVAGFEAALEKVCGTIYPKDGKIIWLNMRQEPIVMSMELQCVQDPPTRLESMLSLEMSLLRIL